MPFARAGAVCLLLCVSLSGAPPDSAKRSYIHDVKPLLDSKCSMCHSPDSRTSGFDIGSVASLLKGGKKNGPAVIPGQSSESPLVQYIRGERQPRMPNGLPPLSEDEISVLASWIATGAIDDTPDSTGVPAASKADAKSANAPKISGAEELLERALFSENSEQLLVLRRGVRLAYVPRPPEPPKMDAALTNPIDQFIVAGWKKAGLKEAATAPVIATDTAFLRRAYLDLIGVIPTIEEARRFAVDSSPDKREKLIDELLARKADYAAHWTPFWEEALASSDTGVVGGIVRHGDYREWIYKSFLENKPYDILVAELIDPTMPGFRKPEAIQQNGDYFVYPQYVLNTSHLETIQTAANTAQTFLGTGMKCASCHDHFLNREWPQKRFLAFAGMFSPHDLEVIRCEQRSGKFVPAKFAFELPGAPADAPKDIDARLHRVAQLLTDPADERFSKTIVNRLWKRYMGLGLFEPVDDYRADRPPTNPELLDWLAYDFMQHGYDLKHTIRLIVTSRTYQLRYDPALEDHFDVAKPSDPRYFRSPSLRRVTAEELIDSIALVGTQQLDPKGRLYLQRKSTDLTRALGRPAARNEISTGRSDDVAVVQALELLNGAEFYDRVYSSPILKKAPSVETLYWAVYSRAPRAEEAAAANKYLQNGGSAGDMLWAMLVSPAFEYIN